MTNYDVSFYCTHCLPRWIHFALLLVIVHQMENLNLKTYDSLLSEEIHRKSMILSHVVEMQIMYMGWLSQDPTTWWMPN